MTTFSPASLIDPDFAASHPNAPPIELPSYDRSRVHVGIVHFGVGVFVRAHLAYYVEQLLQRGGDCLQWGICAVGVRPSSRAIISALSAQHGCYGLIVRGCSADEVEVRVIGAIVEQLYAPDAPDVVFARLLNPATRVVTLTITEAGYRTSNKDTRYDIDHWPDYQLLLSPPPTPPSAGPYPTSVLGWLMLALEARRRAGLSPFAVMSCDNVVHNGDALKAALRSFASAVAATPLLTLIDTALHCPNAQVDRITTLTGEAQLEEAHRGYGLIDGCPVFTEYWTQWSVELPSPAPSPAFPPLHLLSSRPANHVLLVEDVTPFELMKLRLLNGSHSLSCYLGALSGARLVQDYYTQPAFIRFARRYMDEEAGREVGHVPGVDLDAYKAEVLRRFGNRNIADQALRICQDGASKLPYRLVRTLHHNLIAAPAASPPSAKACHLAALGVAGWFAFLVGVDEAGAPLPLNDPRAQELGLGEAARARPYDAAAMFHAARAVFGELSDQHVLVAEVQRALDAIRQYGVKETLRRWLEE